MTSSVRPLLAWRWSQALMFSKQGNKKVQRLTPTRAFYSTFDSPNARHAAWPLSSDYSLRQSWQKKSFIPAFCQNLFPFFFFPPTFASKNKLVSHTALVSLWLRMAHLSVSKGIIIPLGSFAFSEPWQVRGNSEIIYNDGSDSESSIICSCPGEFTLMHSSFMDNGRARTTNLEK